jgi:RNA polymerase sigma-70 factor, ECF subfamily
MTAIATNDGRRQRARADHKRHRLVVLLARTAEGDQRAFGELHAATAAKMRKSVAALMPDAAELDDLMQEAYLKVWRSAHQYRAPVSSPITWMIRIMRNCAIDRLRRPRLPFCPLDVEALSVAGDVVDPIAERDFARLSTTALAAVQGLSPARAELLAEAYLQGLSREVLAQRYNVPASTIKTWIRRSRASVRAQMVGPEPGDFLDAGPRLAQ